jgi:hypothetical protein
MSTTITITKSIEVDIDTVETERGNVARVATVDQGYLTPTTVATATIYQSDDRPDGSAKYTVTGNFVDNYAVEAKARAYADGAIDGVSFDSEQGQFFAYTKDVVAAERLATAVVKAAVAVALEAGAL